MFNNKFMYNDDKVLIKTANMVVWTNFIINNIRDKTSTVNFLSRTSRDYPDSFSKIAYEYTTKYKIKYNPITIKIKSKPKNIIKRNTIYVAYIF